MYELNCTCDLKYTFFYERNTQDDTQEMWKWFGLVKLVVEVLQK